jgi:hypothetical protein
VCGDPVVPTDAAALLEWLEGGNYLGWDAESGLHPSSGPHFGDVRTFVHPCMAESLDVFVYDVSTHPVGATAIKELYGAGDVLLGWSVEVKIAEGEGGDTWYWYEQFMGVTTADSIGDPICSDCHAEGLDMYTSFWPLL